MIPSLFLSHGAPTLLLDAVPARDFLARLGGELPRPSAIIVASAHWETSVPTITAAPHPETIHDFSGFPEALYRQTYPAPGSPDLAERVADLLTPAGLACHIDGQRGLDHGAWVPLKLLYPEADIPVIQLSIQPHLGPGHHYQLGRALAPLRAENVLIIGSGSLTHNLRELDWSGAAGEPQWVSEFAQWFEQALREGRTCDLLAYRRLAPHAERAHPRDEHLLPLFVALGAGGDGARARQLHASATFGSLRMDAYEFSSPAPSE